MKLTYKIGIIGILLFTLLLAACGLVPTDMSNNLPIGTPAGNNAEETSHSAIDATQPVNPPEVRNAPLPHGEFVIYYLDVGQGAAALVICDGETMLIDGGGAASSSLIYSFLQRLGIDHLDYIVNTHPHEDHVGGLSGALNRVSSVGVVFGSATEYDTRAFESFLRNLDNHGVQITVPKAGDTFMLGSATVVIKGPVREYRDVNNNSIILKIYYGGTSFLFKGDAERESEIDMVEAGLNLSATVLKVSHHGSDTSTTYPFLREVMPEIAIISCGANNQYGHPHENTLSRLRDADVTVFRTDMQGDIIVRSDGANVSVSTERNADIRTNPTEHSVGDEDHYIGNANSLRLHRPSCRTLPAEHNRVYFETVQQGLDAGYDPCNNCRP
jgi:competence protein ComEC